MSEDAAQRMSTARVRDAAGQRECELLRALEENQIPIRRLTARFGFYGAEAEDAVQEIIALAWAGRNGFRGDSAATTWLTRIAINYLSSHRRKLFRRWRLWSEKLHEPRPRAVADHHELNEQYQHALDAVRNLPPRLQRVFVLRYLEEMSVEEVAEMLQIAPGTVRSRGHHARLRLREALKDIQR